MDANEIKEILINAIENEDMTDKKIINNLTLGLSISPPSIPKKDKKFVDFPSKMLWKRSITQPNKFYIPLLDITRKMMRSYAEYWASKSNGTLKADKNNESFVLKLNNHEIRIYHDDKFWYCDIFDLIEEQQEERGGE